MLVNLLRVHSGQKPTHRMCCADVGEHDCLKHPLSLAHSGMLRLTHPIFLHLELPNPLKFSGQDAAILLHPLAPSTLSRNTGTIH